jgi:hypothetical protein
MLNLLSRITVSFLVERIQAPRCRGLLEPLLFRPKRAVVLMNHLTLSALGIPHINRSVEERAALGHEVG